MPARSPLVDAGACLLLLSLGAACTGEDPNDGGMGGSSGSGGTPASDGRYVIEDPEEDCDGVEGLRGAVLLEQSGLTFFGDLSWNDLETGYEASRSPASVEATIVEGGTLTCIPYRHFPGEPPDYARLSYDAASLSMTTDDGLLEESGPAVVWLTETSTAGLLTRQVVRAFPVADAEGTFEVSPVLDDTYETLVLVLSPSEETPYGIVSVANEEPATLLDGGDVGFGAPHGFFPALP
jgi:hypothetical protein